MADDKPDPKDSKTDDKTAALSMGELTRLIEGVATKLIGDVKKTESDAREGAGKYQDENLSVKSNAADDIASRVQAEIAKMRQQETQASRDKDLDAMLAAFKDKPAEKAPVERRKIHRFMGWGEPSE